jgi:hypothetical protein
MAELSRVCITAVGFMHGISPFPSPPKYCSSLYGRLKRTNCCVCSVYRREHRRGWGWDSDSGNTPKHTTQWTAAGSWARRGNMKEQSLVQLVMFHPCGNWHFNLKGNADWTTPITCSSRDKYKWWNTCNTLVTGRINLGDCELLQLYMKRDIIIL